MDETGNLVIDWEDPNISLNSYEDEAMTEFQDKLDN